MKSEKLTYSWFGPYRVQYALPNNTILLVALRHFDKNAVIVNSNKLKNYVLSEGTFLKMVIPEEAFEDLVREIQLPTTKTHLALPSDFRHQLEFYQSRVRD